MKGRGGIPAKRDQGWTRHAYAVDAQPEEPEGLRAAQWKDRPEERRAGQKSRWPPCSPAVCGRPRAPAGEPEGSPDDF